MNRFLLCGALMCIFSISSVAQADGFARVSNGNNDGVGSLRAALNSGASIVKILRSVKTISINETLTYSATSSLRIVGSKQTIDGSALSPDANI